MKNIYYVQLSGYSILRLDDSITSAREWAKKAFPRDHPFVTRQSMFCDSCACEPCVCGTLRNSGAKSGKKNPSIAKKEVAR